MRLNDAIISLKHSLLKSQNEAGKHSELSGLIDWVSEFIVADGVPFEDSRKSKFTSLISVALNLLRSGSHHSVLSEMMVAPVPIVQGFRGTVEDWIPLILLDPAASSARREDYSNIQIESDFERFFLEELLIDEFKVWRQLFCLQRPLNELGAHPGNLGRVDFSFQSPFTYPREGIQNRYHRDLPDGVKVFYNPTHVIEIDGARYHKWFQDNARDHIIAELGHQTKRIHEHNVESDWARTIQSLKEDKFLRLALQIQNQPSEVWLESKLLRVISSLRIQVTLLRSLSRRVELQEKTEGITILFLERDLVAADWATQQLNELLKHLSAISGVDFPVFHAMSISERGFEPLSEALGARGLDPKDYDLVIDHSVLRREGVFRHDTNEFLQNEVRIRSAHYQWGGKRIETGQLIAYDPPVQRVEGREEVYSRNEKLIEHYRYFLRRFFGKEDFRPGQLEILSRALERKSVIGLLPTGGGKSLTYQFAAILQPGVCIVVDPIRALMKDQFDSLKNSGFSNVDYVNSARSVGASRAALESFANGEVWMMFVSPERFMIPSFREAVSKAKANGIEFSYGVIDEAHCVSEWGHDFRTAYLDLGRTMQMICKPNEQNNTFPLFGLTATASFDVLADIERELQIEQDDGQVLVRFENSIRNEVLYQVVESESKLKEIAETIEGESKELVQISSGKELAESLKLAYNEFAGERVQSELTEVEYVRQHLIRMTPSDADVAHNSVDGFAAIVFCPHKTGALGVERFYHELRNRFRAGYFHGGTDGPRAAEIERAMWSNLTSYRDGDLNLMVATKAFGMGIDKANIRQTVHVCSPGSIESFVQESGRCGRDGKIARSTIMISPNLQSEREVLESFHRNSFKGEHKERVMVYELRNLISFPAVTGLRRTLIEFKAANPHLGDLKAKFGSGRWRDTLFFTDALGKDLGRWNVHESRFFVREPASSFLTWLVDGTEMQGTQLVDFLRESTVSFKRTGLERCWNELQIGQAKVLPVPFRNAYAKIKKLNHGDRRFEPSQLHVDFLLEKEHTHSMILGKPSLAQKVKEGFIHSFKNNATPDEFIANLEGIIQEKLTSEVIEELRFSYVVSRDEKDTAKALHRLMIVGLITEYEIDYQNEIYLVKVEKHANEFYFQRVNDYLRRYSSRKFALEQIKAAKKQFDRLQADGSAASIFSVLFQLIMSFAYSRISEKRMRAIDDMIGLTSEALEINGGRNQSDFIKERIYYHFNAKYSRSGNQAIVNGVEHPASFQDDLNARDNEESIAQVVKRYSRLVEIDESDAFKTNLKHLRGACNRFARSISGHPEFKILNGGARLILQPNSRFALQEARQEFIDGLYEWWKTEGSDFNINESMQVIQDWLIQHLGVDLVQRALEDVDVQIRFDMLREEVTGVIDWLESFNNRLSPHAQE